MSNTAWRIVQALFLAVVVAYAVWTNDYGLIGFVAGVFVGNLAAIRLGNLGLATAPFWTLTVAFAVVGFGLAWLPFMPRIVGSFLFAAGLFAAVMMPFHRYGIGSRERVD